MITYNFQKSRKELFVAFKKEKKKLLTDMQLSENVSQYVYMSALYIS